MTNEELIQEASAAQRLLNDTLLQDTLAAIEEQYLDNFRKSEVPSDQKLFWQLRAVDDLRKELRTKLDRGTVAERQSR